jgi:hypothetical protein
VRLTLSLVLIGAVTLYGASFINPARSAEAVHSEPAVARGGELGNPPMICSHGPGSNLGSRVIGSVSAILGSSGLRTTPHA